MIRALPILLCLLLTGCGGSSSATAPGDLPLTLRAELTWTGIALMSLHAEAPAPGIPGNDTSYQFSPETLAWLPGTVEPGSYTFTLSAYWFGGREDVDTPWHLTLWGDGLLIAHYEGVLEGCYDAIRGEDCEAVVQWSP